jgi:hypothetical protein
MGIFDKFIGIVGGAAGGKSMPFTEFFQTEWVRYHKKFFKRTNFFDDEW